MLLAAYRDVKRERGLADMADLETGAERLQRIAEALAHQARVRHLLIDEFQDTSPLQWRALDAWLSGYALSLIHIPSPRDISGSRMPSSA